MLSLYFSLGVRAFVTGLSPISIPRFPNLKSYFSIVRESAKCFNDIYIFLKQLNHEKYKTNYLIQKKGSI